jgi:hypothetical protein
MSKQPLYERLSRARQTWDWPVSHFIIFVLALPLLLLWLLVGLLSWWILFLLGWVRAGVTVEILAALIPAFIGFAVQQWSLLVTEEKRREDQRKEAQNDIRRVARLVKSNPSEGSRRYLEYSRHDDWVWQDPVIQQRLKGMWETTSPKALQHTVTLWRAFDENRWEETVGQSSNVEVYYRSLVWAWRILDEDWQQNRIRRMLPEVVQRNIEQELWQAIFKPWHHVCFWRDGCFVPPPDVAEGVRLLELQRNPFGSERAEFDELLFTCRIEREELGLLQTYQPHIVIGEHGSGKTALAFFMVHDCVNSRTVFPVYVPTFPVDPSRYVQLDNLARAAARTLLHYLAFYPRSFLTQDIANRSALAHLLGLYIGTGSTLALELQKAGLEPLGSGEQMLKELERLLQKVSLAAPPEDELIDLLGAARPREFERVSLLLDLPDIHTTVAETRASDLAHTLLDLMQPFQRARVYLKIFLPAELGAVVQGNPAIRLTWSDTELQSLLRKRLEVCGIDGQSLAILCDVSARTASPDARLVRAARGLPGRLIHLGNQLVARVASHSDNPRITAQDLGDVLDKLPN